MSIDHDIVSARVSLIIPTLNPIDFDRPFRRMVDLLRARFPALELVIVDSESESGKIDSHRSLADHFLVVKRASFNHGGTRNLAAKLAKGDVLVFMTQDAILATPDALLELLRPLYEMEKVALCFGRQLARVGATPIESFARAFNYPDRYQLKKFDPSVPSSGSLKLFFNSNVFSAYKARAFWEVGGFPEDVILNEDMLINYKLMNKGWWSCYQPRAAVIHSHDYSYRQQFKRYFDIGVSLRDHWSWFEQIRKFGDGKAFARSLLAFLWKQRMYDQFVKAFVDLAARWVGFQLGLRHQAIPLRVKRRLSLHKAFWASHPRVLSS